MEGIDLHDQDVRARACSPPAERAPGWPRSRRPSRPRRRSPPPCTSAAGRPRPAPSSAVISPVEKTRGSPVRTLVAVTWVTIPPGAFTRVEVDLRHQQVAQRVQVERVELVGREHPPDPSPSSGSPASGRGCSVPLIRSHQVRCAGEKRAASLTAFQNAASAARAPSRPPRAYPSASTTAFIAPGARAARLDDLDPLVLEQPVEHPPGQRPVRPAALQRQVQRLRGRTTEPCSSPAPSAPAKDSGAWCAAASAFAHRLRRFASARRPPAGSAR